MSNFDNYVTSGEFCFIIDRSKECDVRIQLPDVSKEHCRIDVSQDGEVSHHCLLLPSSKSNHQPHFVVYKHITTCPLFSLGSTVKTLPI